MSTQTLIAHYANALKKRGDLTLPKQTATALARFITQLRKDGVSEDQIEAGLDILVAKGLTPGALAGAVIEAAVHKPSRKEVCPICHISFKSKSRLTEHLSDVHHVDAPIAADQSQGR